MKKGNILKEAIADAKAVREVALANAKAALEEAFTPKLQNMLSAKLSEELDEDMYDEDEKDMDEMDMFDEDEKDMDEMDMYDEDEKDMDEMDYDEDENSMDEEIDLDEILNELELEEGEKADEDTVDEAKEDDEEIVDEAKDDEEETLDENEEFDLDALLKEINDLDEQVPTKMTTPQPSKVVPRGKNRKGMKIKPKKNPMNNRRTVKSPQGVRMDEKYGCSDKVSELNEVKRKLHKTKEAFNTVKGELNEVNLLNSKLLYVNRIFKANTLNDDQKLRVVETLDRAGSVKETKLIYETIKNSFSIAKTEKTGKKRTKSLSENFKGMASKAAGNSTAPKKTIFSESNDMVNRFQRLANIKITE